MIYLILNINILMNDQNTQLKCIKKEKEMVEKEMVEKEMVEKEMVKKKMVEKKVVKVLFIKGFNTHKKIDNIYFVFDIYAIKNKYIKIEYFNYEPSENINEVYNKLINEIHYTNYNILIGHSLGGGLLLKYCKEYDISLFDKIIFLMPYIYTSPYSLVHILLKMNLISIESICLPQILLSSNCTENYYSFIPLKQIFQVYTNVFLPLPEIIKILNSSKNIYFVYANDEKVTTIDDHILDKINDVIYVDGTHVGFCERNYNSIHFFRMLNDLFENKIIKKGKSKNDIQNEYIVIEKDLENNTISSHIKKII